MPYTQIELDDEPTVVVCDDCGAHASSEEEVEHFPSCRPGESEKWCKFYEEGHALEEVSDD